LRRQRRKHSGKEEKVGKRSRKLWIGSFKTKEGRGPYQLLNCEKREKPMSGSESENARTTLYPEKRGLGMNIKFALDCLVVRKNRAQRNIRLK